LEQFFAGTAGFFQHPQVRFHAMLNQSGHGVILCLESRWFLIQ
jgi:hypothetical protein